MWALVTQVCYVLWLPLMFAFGYLLGSIFGYEPGTQESVGVGALLANIVVALVVIPLPSWIGVGFAIKARQLGGRVAAAVALLLCALTGIALAIASLPLNGV
jgi:hypothetical protein